MPNSLFVIVLSEVSGEILHSASVPSLRSGLRMTDYDCAEYNPVRVGGLCLCSSDFNRRGKEVPNLFSRP
jgi:hypothetical protein